MFHVYGFPNIVFHQLINLSSITLIKITKITNGIIPVKMMFNGKVKDINKKRLKKNSIARKTGMTIAQKIPWKTSGKYSKLILGNFNMSL